VSHTVPAIYDAGVFRPLEPVELADGTHVELRFVTSVDSAASEMNSEIQTAWRDYLDRMETLPDPGAPDGLTNRDHDRIIYGV
jgi:predicted DNA-binding antitoxin AbrB/MazE fold protein